MPPAPIRKGLVLYKLIANDGVSNFQVTIFNNEYAYYGIKAGEEYVFAGRFSRTGGRYQLALSSYVEEKDAGTLRPVYNLTEGLSNGMVSNNMAEAVERFADLLPDPMPRDVLRDHQLCQLRYAVDNIHFPQGKEAYDIARRRLVFEEFFTLSLGSSASGSRERQETAVRLPEVDLAPFEQSLPLRPHRAHKSAPSARFSRICRSPSP